MSVSREHKRWVNRLRAQYGKKNGVIWWAYLDDWRMEVKNITSKRNYRRHAMTRPDGDG